MSDLLKICTPELSSALKRNHHTIEQLLALRREERPDARYWRDFLSEFHRREREKALRESPVTRRLKGLGGWFADLGPAKWAYGLGLAYATATLVFILGLRDAPVESLPTAPVNRPVVPSPEAAPTVDPKQPLPEDPRQEF